MQAQANFKKSREDPCSAHHLSLLKTLKFSGVKIFLKPSLLPQKVTNR